MITWQDLHHQALSVQQLYALLQLRCAVFIVEQSCLYQDIDGEDLRGENRHILAWRDQQLVACARILHSDKADQPLMIGRVIVAPTARGEKLGYALLEQALACCQQHWPQKNIALSAQAHLQPFYRRLGFQSVGECYLEDGIAHIRMIYQPEADKKEERS
ncbi:GNAT family N-acetyltransferase [Enterobacteriaceae bacterium ESL0689]|nr:GNAT family N-acetyltransferase [Enterobacteriaceae bacterium ESL0689]